MNLVPIIENPIEFDNVIGVSAECKSSTFKHEAFVISTHCTCSINGNYSSISIMPRDIVLNCIAEHMLALDRDSIYFELIVKDEWENARFFAKYNTIIGSRYIADIPKESIPDWILDN